MNKPFSSSLSRVALHQDEVYPKTSRRNGGGILPPPLIAGAFSAITIGVTEAFLPFKETAINVNEFQMGLVAAALTLGVLAMSLPTGWLLDRFTGTSIYYLGAVAAVLIYSLLAYLDELAFLVSILVRLASWFSLGYVSVQKAFVAFMQKESLASAERLRATQMAGLFVIGPMLGSPFRDVGADRAFRGHIRKRSGRLCRTYSCV
ncbi:MAG: hypothetical protein WBN86_11595 [Porticoccaceae bacterium]